MNPIDTNDLSKARDLLLKGEVVGIPTETVYGLAGSIESEKGLRRIFSLKERPFFDPLIVHVSSFRQAASLVLEWPPLADFLARRFWPGALTIVLPKAPHVNPLITSGLDTVAIRMPDHSIARDLIDILGHPLAAPSANKFGRTSPSQASHVRDEFANDNLFVIDGGECQIGVESTVIAFQSGDDNTEVQILRPGGITQTMLEHALERWGKPTTVRRAASEASPGHLKHHYMPKLPLVILPMNDDAGISATLQKEIINKLSLKKIERPVELVLSNEPALAARELYSEMRKVSEVAHADLIYIRAPVSPPSGLWEAIWDRLGRAASLDLR